MGFHHEHELHNRRWGRNLGVGLALAAFAALVFGLTIVKMSNGNRMQAYDHSYRVTIDPDTVAAPAPALGAQPGGDQ